MMLNNTYVFNIDTKNGLINQENIQLKNSSINTYHFSISLFKDDEPLLLTDKQYIATLYTKHSTRNPVSIKGEIKGNVCLFKLSKKAYQEQGIYTFDLEITGEEGVILSIEGGKYRVLDSLSKIDIDETEDNLVEVKIDNKIEIHNKDDNSHKDMRDQLLQLTESNLSKEQVNGFIDEKINPLKEELHSSLQEHIEQAESIYLKDEDIENLLRNEDIDKLLKDISFNENQLTLTFKDDTTKKVSLDTLTVDLSQYVKNESLLQKLNEYYTKIQSDERFLTKTEAHELYQEKLDTSTIALKTDLEPFMTTEDLTGYALKTDLEGFLTDESLTGYAVKTEIEKTYAKKNELDSTYAKKTDLSTYALKTELEAFITNEDLTGYALKTELEAFITTDDLTGYVKETSLNNYYQKNEVDNLFLKKSELDSSLEGKLEPYMKTSELETALTPYMKKTELDTALTPYLTQEKADELYMKKGEQGGGGAIEIPEDVVRRADLENYYTKAKTDELFYPKAKTDELFLKKTDATGYVNEERVRQIIQEEMSKILTALE